MFIIVCNYQVRPAPHSSLSSQPADCCQVEGTWCLQPAELLSLSLSLYVILGETILPESVDSSQPVSSSRPRALQLCWNGFCSFGVGEKGVTGHWAGPSVVI